MFRKPAILLSIVMTAAASLAVAASKQSLSFDLKEKTSLGGTELAPGHYKLTWAGESAVKVEVVQAGKVVASGTGKLVERGQKAPDDAVVSRRNGSGMVLSEVRFGGKKSVLVLGES